jgi:uncharacterized protein YndB with AHSA1/START domain
MTATAADLGRTIREIRQSGETFGVVLRRSFPVSVEQLWRSCTKDAPLSRWLGRIEGNTASGEFVLVLPGGRTGDVRTQVRVLRCEPPIRLDLRWTFDGADSAVSALIEPDGTGARLTIEHYAHTEDSAVGYGPGWEEFLTDLEDVLADRPRQHDCADLERQCSAKWHGLPRLADSRFGGIDRAGGRYTTSRHYPVGTDRLWTALTTSEGLSGWFGSASGRLELQGQWRIDFSGGHALGQVEDCDPGRSFRTTYRQGIDPDDAASHLVEVRVDAEDVGSRLTLSHSVPPESGDRLLEGLAAGWVAHLNGLGTALDGSVPAERDWLADFSAARLVHRRRTAPTG